ncbi:MAG: phosphatidylglycerol lysyltransferase domain-containing protein [Desulfohalobiaceae bacterium]|nr:phosphatidylglycerol lysyltransferase domain-containing protein [Desulfohalobiaceae bacterium]
MKLDFQPLSLQGQTKYRKILGTTPQLVSDYSFVNIWSWREVYGLEWAFDEKLVWIRQNRPERQYWAPMGPWGQTDWSTVFEGDWWKGEQFTRIPEKLHELWLHFCPAACAGLVSNRDHWDYLYLVEELIALKGNRFHKKKNLLRQFIRNYDYTYQPLTEDLVDKALTLQTEWCLWRDCEETTTLESENQAILNAFADWQDLEGIFGAGLEVDGNMVAYTVAEALDETTLVIHFEKGCPQHKGVYQAINQMFLVNSASQYTYVNREQDLGDAGLRKAKESYNPVGYMNKYSGCLG